MFTENFQKLFGLDTENIGFLNTDSFKVEFKMFDLLKCYDNRNDIVKYSIVIEPKNYDTLESLFQEIHRSMDEQVPNSSSFANFSYIDNIKRIKFNSTDIDVKVELSPALNKLLGFKENTVLRGATSNLANNAPNLKYNLQSMWVYSNIVRPVYVGDALANLLRIIPVEGNERQTVIKTYEKPHYVDLSMNNLSMIEVQINTAYGLSPIVFKDDVIIKLHFRRKKYIQIH